MISKTQAYRLMPLAWSVTWLLSGVGATISDIYSSPSKSLFPFLALSAVGWAGAGYITACASNGKSGMTVQLVAWAAAYLVAIPLGLVRLLGKDMVPIFLFVLPFMASGAIGGFASSSRKGVWRLLSGALLGFVFLIFSPVFTYYAGSILMLLYSSIVHPYGGPINSSYIPLFWILPNTVFGIVTGFVARWILGFKAVDPANVLA
jgi:hypothetical protein